MINDGTYFVRKNLFEIVTTVDNNLAMSTMRLLDCYMSNYIETEVRKISPEQVDDLGS
jgi:dynein heavy chain